MIRWRATIAAALTAAFAAPAVAQGEDVVPDPAAMDKLAAEVPAQSWYPEGYYDVRLAAEAQVAETPRDAGSYVGPCVEGGGSCYDPFDPLPRHINIGESDPVLRRYGNIALDIARLRQELSRAGYPAALYAKPLATYEYRLVEATASTGATKADTAIASVRALTTTIEANRKTQAPSLPRVLGYDEAADQVVVIRSSGPSSRIYPVGKRLAGNAKLVIKAGDRIELLNVEGTRTLTGPGTFSVGKPMAGIFGALLASPVPRRAVGAVRGGAGSGGVILQTNPPSGEVLLVSAFAFRICQRKIADPWDRFQCKWNEVETGVAKPLSGRFVYQVRWPDGIVRKGTREILPAEAGAVTFKKTGS